MMSIRMFENLDQDIARTLAAVPKHGYPNAEASKIRYFSEVYSRWYPHAEDMDKNTAYAHRVGTTATAVVLADIELDRC